MLRLVSLLWLLIFATLVGGVGSAWAHATLIATVPADGAVLDAGPRVVQLRFNEPVSPLAVHLIDARGQSQQGVTVSARNETVEVTLPTELSQGTQILSYRMVSADGHPVAGSMVFSIGQTGGAPTPAQQSAEARVQSLIWLTRVALYLGLFGGVGGAFFAAWIAPRQSAVPSIVRPALGLGLFAAAASLGLQGLDALGLDLSAIIFPKVWVTGFGTSLGPAMVAAVGAVVAGYLSLTRSSGWRRTLSGAGLLAVGFAFALTGHASAASPQWLTRPAVLLHGVAVTYWVGALIPLLVMLWRREPALVTVQRFSTVAVPLVALLIITGTVLSVIQIGGWSALAATAYGNVLLAKMVSVVGLLGLATLNRLSLTPALSASGAEHRLAWSIGAEIALVVVILALVAVWRFTPPPRAIVPPQQPAPLAEPAIALLHGERTMAQVILTPGQVGQIRATISVMGADHAPTEAKEVSLSVALPSLGIEPLERRATKAERGQWIVESLPMPLPGSWRVQIDVLVSDFEKTTLEGEITVSPPGSRGIPSAPADTLATQAYRAANTKMHRDMDISYSGDADVDYVLGMIPHHQAAIDMARVVLQHGKDEQTKRFAAEVIREQEREIAEMREWLKKRAVVSDIR